MGQLRYYIRIKFEVQGEKIVLRQNAYFRRIIKRFQMARVACCSTPMLTKTDDLLKAMHVDEAETGGMKFVPYRALFGGLLYLSCHTKSGNRISGGHVGKIHENSISSSLETREGIFRYLARTLAHGIIVRSVEPVVFKEFEVD